MMVAVMVCVRAHALGGGFVVLMPPLCLGGFWCFQALLCSGFLRFSSVSWVA